MFGLVMAKIFNSQIILVVRASVYKKGSFPVSSPVMLSVRCFSNRQGVNLSKNSSNMYSTFRRGVNFLFKKNLLITNSVTSGGFMAIGDLVQQEFEFQSKVLLKRYDWARLGRMFIVGTLMGPMHHYYYVNLDKVLPKADYRTVFKKIVCDQLFASPATILCFFYGMGILESKSFSQSTAEIVQKFKYVYTGDCLYWPPVQFVNFYYLPTEYRVVYINVATMIFNIFLSYMKHYDQH